MSKHLPQNKIQPDEYIPSFLVTKHLPLTNEAIAKFPSTEVKVGGYKEGQVALLSYEGFTRKGCVRAINYSTRQVLVSLPNGLEEVPSSFTIQKWMDLPIEHPKFTSDICLIESIGDSCYLDVHCDIKGKTKAGLVSWSLYYKLDSKDSYQEVAVGHDYYSQSVCSLHKDNSLWKAGEYLLVANRYSEHSRVLVKTDTQNWLRDGLSSKISCGGYLDSIAPLFL